MWTLLIFLACRKTFFSFFCHAWSHLFRNLYFRIHTSGCPNTPLAISLSFLVLCPHLTALYVTLESLFRSYLFSRAEPFPWSFLYPTLLFAFHSIPLLPPRIFLSLLPFSIHEHPFPASRTSYFTLLKNGPK